MKKVLITVSGKDQPGIIAKVSGLLYARGCNLEDISMTLLEGQFAMMLTACLPSKEVLGRVLQGLELLAHKPWALDYHVTYLKGEAFRGKKQGGKGIPYLISAFGKDRTGIVYEVSRTLAAMRVNITDLDSRILGKSGKATYAMLLEVEVPAKQSLKTLKKALSAAAKKLKVEIQLKPLERVSF